MIGTTLSRRLELKLDFCHGSVFGSIIFAVFTNPVAFLRECKFSKIANVAFKSLCYQTHKLKLNPDNTDLVLIYNDIQGIRWHHGQTRVTKMEVDKSPYKIFIQVSPSLDPKQISSLGKCSSQ